MTDGLSIDALAAGVQSGDIATLARAITLVESTRDADQDRAQELIERVLPHTGKAVRVGITGVPGVGKSTFIDALGSQLTAQGKRVAVLAIDPSSSLSGGSILGDKTRMERLSRDPAAYIRPSPGAGTLGGVARRTREALLLCEAAGFDVILVETIGVGQSEIAVAQLVDVFLLLALTGAGDELQGIKKGITEMADVVAITKADGDNTLRADSAKAQLAMALHLLHGSSGRPSPQVLTCSAREGTGLDEVWAAIEAFRSGLEEAGTLHTKRRQQALHWMEAALDDLLRARFESAPGVPEQLAAMRQRVLDGTLGPAAAARLLLDD